MADEKTTFSIPPFVIYGNGIDRKVSFSISNGFFNLYLNTTGKDSKPVTNFSLNRQQIKFLWLEFKSLLESTGAEKKKLIMINSKRSKTDRGYDTVKYMVSPFRDEKGEIMLEIQYKSNDDRAVDVFSFVTKEFYARGSDAISPAENSKINALSFLDFLYHATDYMAYTNVPREPRGNGGRSGGGNYRSSYSGGGNSGGSNGGSQNSSYHDDDVNL